VCRENGHCWHEDARRRVFSRNPIAGRLAMVAARHGAPGVIYRRGETDKIDFKLGGHPFSAKPCYYCV